MRPLDPLFNCQICNGMTNGYGLHGYITCVYCHKKYEHIPSHIPIKLWGKYVKVERKRKREAKKLSLL
jgi:hypothetical protein